MGWRVRFCRWGGEYVFVGGVESTFLQVGGEYVFVSGVENTFL